MKRIYSYDPQNPLMIFYEKLKKDNKNKGRINNWRILSEMTGIPVQTLISISRANKKNILGIKLSTYLNLRDSIEVDMLSFGKEE